MQPEDEIYKRNQFMNKIDPINETSQSQTVSNIKSSKDKKADAFENALSKALDPGSATPVKATDKIKGSKMENTAVGGLQEIISKDFNIINSSDIVSGQTDKLLGMLDSYSSQLVDPDISLKSIAPIVEDINNNAGNLLKETQNLTDSDVSLKEIATHTVITAQTEYLKFQRGDYIN